MEFEFKTESVVIGEQEVVIYEGTLRKHIRILSRI